MNNLRTTFMLFTLMSFVAFAFLLQSPIYAFSGNGTGTLVDPYQITTCTQLQEMSGDLSAHYSLEQNIDCTASQSWNGGLGFAPIGPALVNAFAGSLDGKIYTIDHLYMNREDSYVGMFGSTTSSAVIKNLNMTNVTVQSTTADATGGLIAQGGGSVDTCTISGTVSGNNHVGAIAGLFTGDVYTASATATVTGTDYVGGLIGYFSGISPSAIDYSQFSGTVSGVNTVGGLVGYNLGTVTNSHSSGTVSSVDEVSTNIGGLIGYAEGDAVVVTDNYAACNVNTPTTSQRIGGLIGGYEGSASVQRNNVQNSITVSGGVDVGGYIGLLYGSTINQGTATVSTILGVTNVGGFIGRITGAAGNLAAITNSTTAGTSVTGTDTVGGFVGLIENQYCSISSSGTTIPVIATTNFGKFYGVNNGGTLSNNTFPGDAVIPSISTGAVSAITSSGMTVGATITDDGGAAITERGVVYSSTETLPTVTSSKAVIDGTVGSYSAVLSGLTEKTQYYVRAYATNSVGTAYGDVVQATTLQGLPLTLKNVYFTFGKLRYGRYASPSQLRSGDYIYLKNYDPKKIQLLAISLYDYTKKGNQCYSRTWKTSTSMYMKTCAYLPTKRKYAFIFTFKDTATQIVIKKYFVVNTISSTTITY